MSVPAIPSRPGRNYRSAMGLGADFGVDAAKRPALPVAGRLWRMGALAVVVGLLLYGSAWGDDDLFPFGPMTQYSFRIDPDGEIRSLWVEADLADGTHRRLDISNAGDLGVARAELEGQLDRIIAEPDRLETLAEAWVRLHPDRPELRRIVVGQDVIELSGGRQDGTRTDTFAAWSAGAGVGLEEVVPR